MRDQFGQTAPNEIPDKAGHFCRFRHCAAAALAFMTVTACATTSAPVEPTPMIFGTVTKTDATKKIDSGSDKKADPAIPLASDATSTSGTFSEMFAQAIETEALDGKQVKIFRDIFANIPALNEVVVTDVYAGGGALVANTEFLGVKWSFIAYTGGDQDSSFLAFAPETELSFSTLFGPLVDELGLPGLDSIGNPGDDNLFISLAEEAQASLPSPSDIVRSILPNDQVFILALNDIKINRKTMPKAVLAVTDAFTEDPNDNSGGKYLIAPAGLTQYGRYDLADVEILGDVITFLGSKSTDVYTAAHLEVDVFQSLLEGTPKPPELVLKAFLPEFRPSFGNYFELPVDYKFELRATLSAEGWGDEDAPDGKKVPIGVTLGLTGRNQIEIEGQKVPFSISADVVQGPGVPVFSVTGTVFEGEPWKKAFGVDWLTIENYRMRFGQEADGVFAGIGGDTTIGEKRFKAFGEATVSTKTAGFPIPRIINLSVDDGADKIGSISLHDFLSIYAEMMNLTGFKNAKVPEGLPNISLTGTEVGKGPELALNLQLNAEAGLAASGKLNIFGQDIVTIDKAFIAPVAGVEIKGKTEKIQIGPLALPHGEADIYLGSPKKRDGKLDFPRIALTFNAVELFGSKSQVRMDMKVNQLELSSLLDFGDFLKFDFLATTGDPIETLEQLANADLSLEMSLSSDPMEYVRTYGQQLAQEAFDVVRIDPKPYASALKTAKSALNEIEKYRDHALEFQRNVEVAIKQAVFETAEDAIIETNKQIEYFAEARFILTGAIDDELGAPVAETTVNAAECAARTTTPFGIAVTIIGGGDFSACSNAVDNIGGKGTAKYLGLDRVNPALNSLRDEIESITGERDVALIALNAAKSADKYAYEVRDELTKFVDPIEKAKVAVEAANLSLKAVEELNKLFQELIDQIGNIDILALERATIRVDSLSDALNGEAIDVDLRIRAFGSPLQHSFSFYANDPIANLEELGGLAASIVENEIQKTVSLYSKGTTGVVPVEQILEKQDRRIIQEFKAEHATLNSQPSSCYQNSGKSRDWEGFYSCNRMAREAAKRIKERRLTISVNLKCTKSDEKAAGLVDMDPMKLRFRTVIHYKNGPAEHGPWTWVYKHEGSEKNVDTDFNLTKNYSQILDYTKKGGPNLSKSKIEFDYHMTDKDPILNKDEVANGGRVELLGSKKNLKFNIETSDFVFAVSTKANLQPTR